MTTNINKEHEIVIKFFKKHGGIIDWTDPSITPELSQLIFNSIPEVVRSYTETETYMLNKEFKKE